MIGGETKKDQTSPQEPEKKDVPYTPSFPQPNDPKLPDPDVNKNKGGR